MIPTFVHLETSRNNANLTAYQTGTITFTPNRLAILVLHHVISASGINTPTPTGCISTWTQIQTLANGTTNRRLTLFRGLTGSSPTSEPIGMSFASQLQLNCEWSVLEVGDTVLTGTNGADAIAQSKTGSAAGVTSLSLTFTSSYGHADNLALGAFAHDNASQFFIAGNNFTMLGQAQGSSANAGVGTEYGRDIDLIVDMSVTSGALAWLGISVELVGATTVAAPSVVLRRTRRKGLNARLN